MAVNRYGNEDFASDFAAGAQVGNMIAMRRERELQLRSQQALQAVHERQLDAQANMLLQHAQYYKEQAQKLDEAEKNQEAFKAAVGSTFQQNLAQSQDPETGEYDMPTAIARTHSVLSRLDPEMANKWADSQSKIQAPVVRGQYQLQATQLRGTGNPKLDSFGQAWEGYQKALASGDEESVKTWQGRLKLLSGQLPSGALKEGNDLASTRMALDNVEEGLRESPNDLSLQREKRRLQTVIDSMESRHGQEEISVSTPGGPEVRIVKGGKKEPGALTQGEVTRYGEDVQATSNALRSILTLRSELGPETVGVGPKLGNFIFDKVLSQFDPELTNQARVEGRQDIQLATQAVLGELGNRQRFSQQELNAIKEAMPSLGAAESTPNAQIKLDRLALMLAEKGAAAAVSIQRPVPGEIIQTLSNLFPATQQGERAMAEEVKAGKLNANVALQVRKWQKSKGM